jgi:hypothetical protein
MCHPFGACDGHRYAHLQILSTSETIHHSMSSFSLELATGCAMPPSRYYPHPKRSTNLCPPTLWSLRQAAPHTPPDIIHIRNHSPFYVNLLFGACDRLHHINLQILSKFELIHHSMFSFSLELATGCATPTSKYYPHLKRSTTLCLPSLWSLRRTAPVRLARLQLLSTSETSHHSMSSFSLELATGCATPTSRCYPHPKRSTTLCLCSLWSLRRAVPPQPPDIIDIRNAPPLYVFLLCGSCDGLSHAHLQIIGNHISASPLTFRPSAPSLDRLYKRSREGGKSLFNTGKRGVVTKCDRVFSLFLKKTGVFLGENRTWHLLCGRQAFLLRILQVQHISSCSSLSLCKCKCLSFPTFLLPSP